MSSEPTATVQETPPAAASRWEDYIDVFFSPVELFERRRNDRVAPPFWTLIGLGLLFYFLLLPATQIMIRARATTEEAAAAMERMGTLMAVFGGIGVPIMYAVMVAAAAFLLWLGGRVADIRTDFNRMMLIATYAGFVMLLSQILASVVVIVMGDASFDAMRSMSFGPLRFVGSADMNPFLTALLGRFELFAIWQALLWAIGIRVLYGVSYARAGAVAAVTWFLFLVPTLIGAVMAGTAGPNAG